MFIFKKCLKCIKGVVLLNILLLFLVITKFLANNTICVATSSQNAGSSIDFDKYDAVNAYHLFNRKAYLFELNELKQKHPEMLNQNIDSAEVIRNLAKRINLDNSNTKILAASFHNVAQVNEAISNGAQAVTVGPDIVASAFKMPSISQAVADFRNDWESLYGDKNINNL